MDESDQDRHIENLEREVANLKNELEASRRQVESLSNKVEGNFTLTDHEINWLKEAVQKLAETLQGRISDLEAKSNAALQGVIAKQEEDFAATRNFLQRSFEENTDVVIGKVFDKFKSKLGV